MNKEARIQTLVRAAEIVAPLALVIYGSVFSFSLATKAEIKERQRGRCADCGKELPLHVHHIVPQSLGGSDEYINAVGLCPNDHLHWDNQVMLKGVIYPGKEIEKAAPQQVSDWTKFKRGIAQIRRRSPLPQKIREW